MKKIVATLSLLLTALSCSRDILVYYDSDPTFRGRAYATYRWDAVDPLEQSLHPLYYNELNDKRITAATDAVLVDKGYTLDSVSSDLTVHYHIVVEGRTIVLPHEMPQRTMPPNAAPSLYQYAEGTLILDFMDARTGALLWRGWAVAPLENIRNSDDVTKLVRTSVQKILATFPPGINKGTSQAKKSQQ